MALSLEAQERNLFACLGTGSVKTLITILLISNLMSQATGSYKNGKAKRTFFWIPLVL